MRVTDPSNPVRSSKRVSKNLFVMMLGLAVLLIIAMPIRAMVRELQDRTEGFSIDGRFSPYYEVQGGESIFGKPISQAFIEVETDKVVQYFENVRLELNGDTSGGLVVKPSPLGMMLGAWEAPLTYEGEIQGCRFYHETGHYVCHSFLSYYEEKGGPETFGYPISELKIEDEQMVQYFQWFRLDWFPEDEENPIRPGPLGKLHLSSLNAGDFKAEYVETSQVDELRVVSSVESASTTTSGEQTFYLVVRDQNQKAIEGAAATLIAHFPDEDRMIIMPLTDEEGRSQVTFSFKNQPPGRSVYLEITVVYQGRTKEVRESFMIHLSGGQ